MINVVFCFDENLINQARVAVASLLDASNPDEHYHIYCVCTGNAQLVEADMRADMQKRDSASKLSVLHVEDAYSEAHQVRGITTATYLRLLLPNLLPEVSHIIYTDVDILFRKGLSEIWDTDITGFLIAGVKSAVNTPDKWEWNSVRDYWHLLDGVRGKYFNAGVTVLNLELMREMNLKPVWDEMAQRQFYYQDQDILNITCRDKVCFLDLKWNMLAYISHDEYLGLADCDLYTTEEIEKAYANPAIIHYAGEKPWNRYEINRGSEWWDYVRKDDTLHSLFDEKKARKNHGMSIWKRALRKFRRMVGLEDEHQ